MDRCRLTLRLAALLILLATTAACAPLMQVAGVDPDMLRVDPDVPVVPGGDPLRGAEAIRAYGCDACHTVPGIATANSLVGPPLNGWAERKYIAGKFPNEPDYLIEWIRFPQSYEPGTAMPNLGVTEQDARDISAYMYTLGRDTAR
jgi:cytochrome c2